jgi:SNF2 family DNA or RNA helicase
MSHIECYIWWWIFHAVLIDAADEYNKPESEKFILLTTRAGRLGISPTTAKTIVLYDSDWHAPTQ